MPPAVFRFVTITMTGKDDVLADLPPSAKLVYKVLEYNGAMTQKAIVEESMLSARTVRYALERLEDIGAVSEDVYFADARQNLYEIIAEPGCDGDGTETTDVDARAAE